MTRIPDDDQSSPGTFHRDKPVYEQLGNVAERTGGDSELSRKLDEDRAAEDALPRKLGRVHGLAILCLARRIRERAPSAMPAEHCVTLVSKLSS